VNSSPAKYENWLRQVVTSTKSRYRGDRRLVFINAWNEWGEGNHLEPDQKYGHAFLEATKNALAGGKAGSENGLEDRPNNSVPHLKRAYWQGRKSLRTARALLRNLTFRSFL